MERGASSESRQSVGVRCSCKDGSDGCEHEGRTV